MNDDSQTRDERYFSKFEERVAELIGNQNFAELWAMAVSGPAIITVRIMDSFSSIDWRPPGLDLHVFNELSVRCTKCNLQERPSRARRYPRSVKIAPGPFLCARATADGEYLFAMDSDASSIFVYQLFDFTAIEQIKVDVYKGKQCAVIGFAVSDYGDKMAVLLHEPNTVKTSVRVFRLEDGRVQRDSIVDLKIKRVGTQIPQLAFSRDGKTIVSLTAGFDMCFIDSDAQLQLVSFEPSARYEEKSARDVCPPFEIHDGASLTAWRKYGALCLRHTESGGLSVSDDRTLITALRAAWVLVWKEHCFESAFLVAPSSAGNYAVTTDGDYLLTIDDRKILKHDLHENQDLSSKLEPDGSHFEMSGRSRQIGLCDDHWPRLAVSSDGGLVAIATPQLTSVRLYRVKEEEFLGAVYGLIDGSLADLRITSGGDLIAVNHNGIVQQWEADRNGMIWPWPLQLYSLLSTVFTHHNAVRSRSDYYALDRGWLSPQARAYLGVVDVLLDYHIRTVSS